MPGRGIAGWQGLTLEEYEARCKKASEAALRRKDDRTPEEKKEVYRQATLKRGHFSHADCDHPSTVGARQKCNRHRAWIEAHKGESE